MYVRSYLPSNCTKFDNSFFVIFVILRIKFVRKFKKKDQYIHEENMVSRTSPVVDSYKQCNITITYRRLFIIFIRNMLGNAFIKYYY